MDTEAGITELLQDWSKGRDEALTQLMPLVAEELRRLAESHFRKETPGHTLQPTALVNEVYLRFSSQLKVRLDNRLQFFALASNLMRRILVDHYRSRKTAKRGQGEPKITLDEAQGVPELRELNFLALDDALGGLKALDVRQHRVVELRFFGGLTVPETAKLLGISPATVKREWLSAKAWLLHEMRAD